ncbi:MAG: GNAT family N-acetyltransferase [Deltaproteobacteria bacterium]|nr:GNAT family N-acetyltransferase [Deltaproteobacteria bacterium]
MSTTINFKIRPATEKDSPVILSLIKELAEYERLSHEVIASEDDIRKFLFGKHPFAQALIGENEGNAVSFALYFYNFSTFLGKPGIYLEDLYVQPTHRGKGFGRKMMVHIARLAQEQNCGRFEWSVLNWNTPAIKTYEKLNATPMNEWILYRLSGDSLNKLATEI